MDIERMRTLMKRIIMIFIGTLISSISINGLYIPNNILSGGFTGIAILLNLSLGFDISLSIILLNIPIFILGYKLINREYIFYSLVGMMSLSLCLTLTKGVSFHSDQMLTTLLLGGILNGVGFALVFKSEGSTGGNDIIAKIVHKRYMYSIASVGFGFNIIIISLSAIFFGIDIAITTLVAMYVTSTTIKYLMEGLNYKRTVFIITSQEHAVSKAINREMRRGCTLIKGMGSYTKKNTYVLYTVISIGQLGALKRIVSDIDPKALINVMESHMVFGNGFLNIHDE
ncbi:YitT family protein [Vallitaleaceae bacterium 9-2]